MAYNGFEIDMLNVGDADSILVTNWGNGTAERVLIDGGNEKDCTTIRAFLLGCGVTHIDHLVCSHLHDDHAGGLLGIAQDSSISIGTAWVHRPELHLDVNTARKMVSALMESKEAQLVLASLQTAADLVSVLMSRGIEIREPFVGERIGFLTVLGPTEEYYEELVEQFVNVDQIQKRDSAIASSLLLEARATEETDGLLDNPQTSPENNSSTILGIVPHDSLWLFTADAGVDALRRAADMFDIKGCGWVQLPHHGSRRNLDWPLIDHLRPRVAFASAVGNDKHPRRAVVNGVEKAGGKVYSTHWRKPGGNKWHRTGEVPDRLTYSDAFPLYE